MIKAMFAFGTRPEAIKLAPVFRQLNSDPDHFLPKVCITGQHRQMVDSVLALLEITPDHDLDIMEPDQSLFESAVQCLGKMESVLLKEKPQVVLVQGDTTSAFVASLAAFYMKIPVAHVEAGLRTHDKYRPFPEEINRRLLTVLADMHFAPTQRAKQNLLHDGIPKQSIWVTGNTVVDSLSMMTKRLEQDESRHRHFTSLFPFLDASDGKRIILVTAHRRENFGQALKNICHALIDIIRSNPHVHIVFPVHLNPQVREVVHTTLSGPQTRNRIHLVEPLDYESFVYLMNKAYLILTDSGGIQEEAPALGKPTLVLRDTTERPEAVDAETAKLVGTDRSTIVQETQNLLDSEQEYLRMAQAKSPFGDGKASERIHKALLENADKFRSSFRY